MYNFFTIEHLINFNLNQDIKENLRDWLNTIISTYNYSVNEIDYIFCNDEYLHKINIEYLNHDTYTDVISFQYENNPIGGEIYISIDRIKENAEKFNISFSNELLRVMAHGLLHFIGYNDKEKEEIASIRKEESKCIDLANSKLLKYLNESIKKTDKQ